MLTTAASVQLVIGRPPDATGRNSSPVINMLWASSMCNTLCKKYTLATVIPSNIILWLSGERERGFCTEVTSISAAYH
jgi:hypothetical protein